MQRHERKAKRDHWNVRAMDSRTNRSQIPGDSNTRSRKPQRHGDEQRHNQRRSSSRAVLLVVYEGACLGSIPNRNYYPRKSAKNWPCFGLEVCCRRLRVSVRAFLFTDPRKGRTAACERSNENEITNAATLAIDSYSPQSPAETEK